MRHEVPNLQSIYLLKMCCNLFTHFLIAEDEAQSAKLVQAMLLSYLFSYILLNLSAFLISFLPISGSILSCNFLFSFLYIILTWDTTKFILYFSPLHS